MLRYSQNPPVISPKAESVTQLRGRWWVAHTKARFEKALAWDMVHRDIGYFLPLIERAQISGGRKRRVLLPLFPSYLFFCGSGEDRYAAMRTNRISRTIEVTDQDGLITELAAIEKGLRAAQLEPYQGPPVGRRCRIVSGLLKGVQGIVVRSNHPIRVVLQVSVICCGAAVEIDGDLLELLPEEPAMDAGLNG